MDTTAAQNTPDGYTISESGKFTFNTKCKIRHTPVMSDTGIGDDVTSGQEVGYTGKEKNDNHFWITYTGADSSTLYVPYANITNNTYFGTDSNSDDPIQVSTGGDTGSGSGDTGSGSGSGDTGSGSTTASTDPDAPGAKFRLLNLPLPNQAAQQCFTVFDNSAYVLQIDQSGDSPQLDNVYIARGTVDQSQGTVTFESDYMTLEGFGHCQSLDFYQYNNQVYLWIGLDGKQTDNGHYWGTQLGRIQYTPGQTISSYTDVTRLSNLIAANQNGQDVGTLKRVESTVSEDSSKMVVMDITTDDKVYFTYYDFQQLNALLDQKDNVTPHYLSCETEDSVKALAHDWGSPFQLSDMLSSSQSVQGLAIDSSNNVYISSGSKDTDSYIAKGAWGASYFNQQAVSSPSEDASQWSAGAGIIEIEGLQLYYGNVDATVTKHLHGDSSTEKEDKSYIYSFPETQF